MPELKEKEFSIPKKPETKLKSDFQVSLCLVVIFSKYANPISNFYFLF